MSVTLKRHGTLQTVQVLAYASVDGQGKPTYAASVNISGRVVREDVVVRAANGEDIRTVATVWVDGAQSPLPKVDDKLQLADGLVGIVVERVDGRTIQDVLDNVRVRIREQ